MVKEAKPSLVTFFNHKGGVGKTTITVNLARAFAQNGLKTLVVDADPQCNTSAFFLAEEDLDGLFEGSIQPGQGQTIWSAISLLVRGRGDVRPVVPEKVDNLGVYLLPGDPALAAFEDKLAGAWKDCFSRDLPALDQTSALYRGILATAESIAAKIVLVDVGPSVGSLNRSLLLSSDHFVVPVGCDLYSLRALRSVRDSLVGWMADWKTIQGLSSGIKGANLVPGLPRFLGYVTQHFNIYRARATIPFEEWERKITSRIKDDLVSPLAQMNAVSAPKSAYKIGEVPSFHGLVPESQKHGRPIGALREIPEVNSGYNAKIAEADRVFHALAGEIARRITAS
jgi:cellulose biosynthesis protein BcsQ